MYNKYYLNTKEKPLYVKNKENTYCLVCKKKTDNNNIKGVALETKIGQEKSTCIDCDSKKLTFSKPIKRKKPKKYSSQFTKTYKFIVKAVKNTQVTPFQKYLSWFQRIK